MAIAVDVTRIQEIPLDEIDVHKLNPRREVGEIDGLASSIQDQGVLQPILVVRDNGGWALVDGRRRFAAAQAIGLKTIPAIAREMSEADVATAALVANVLRKDLDPLEEATGYRAWLKATGKSQVDLARTVGLAPSTIANSLRLLEASKPIQEALREKRITPAHARVALELKDAGEISKLQLNGKASVDDLKEAVDDANDLWATAGAGAVERAKMELAGARAKYPNATVTWKSTSFRRAEIVDLVKALGKPPATVFSGIGQYQTLSEAQHAKKCPCMAYELAVGLEYGSRGQHLAFTTERVCIDKIGSAAAIAAKPKPRPVARASSPKPKKPKPPTPQQLAKKAAAERKVTEKEVTKILAAPKSGHVKGAPIFARLRKGTIPADVARAIAYIELVEYCTLRGGAEIVAWQRIEKMPAKKVGALAAAFLANHLEDEILRTRAWAPKGEDPEATHRVVAAYFGVKLAEPKTKKKAKR